MALNALPEQADKRAAVQDMFDRIAPRYDLLNRLISAGLDQSWRRIALDTIGVGAGDIVVDLACGTGDLAEQCAARGARVLGVDFAMEMLRGGRGRRIAAEFLQADGAALPFSDASITALTCGFALRNFVALDEIFSEAARVLEPGGRVALLEVDRPGNRIIAAGHSFYFDRVVPLIGGLLSDRAAYSYLPQSTVYLPPEPELLGMLEAAGFEQVVKRNFLMGAAQLITAVRSKDQ